MSATATRSVPSMPSAPSAPTLERDQSFTIDSGYASHEVPSREELGGGFEGVARQTSTIIQGIVIVLVATLAVVIVASFNNSTSVNSTDNPELANALDSINSGFASMLDLVAPLLLIMIGVVAVAYIRRMQS